MTRANTRTIGLILALMWVSPIALAGEQDNLPRQILLNKSVELPSNKLDVRVVRMIFPRGYKTPLHTHESPGPRYVLRGKLRVEEGGQTHEFGPGEVFWESGQWMTAENIADGETEVVAVELPRGQ